MQASPPHVPAPPSPPSWARLHADGLLDPGGGPLLRLATGTPSAAGDQLRAAWRAGRLLRLVRGVFVPVEHWSVLAPWDRFTLAAVAYARTHPGAVFTGTTAAHLHGLPLIHTPSHLDLRSPGPGHRGTQPLSSSPLAAARPRATTPPPPPPALRWTWNGVQAPGPTPVASGPTTPLPDPPPDPGPVLEPAVAGSHAGPDEPPPPAPPVSVEARLQDGTALGPITVDPLATVQLFLGSRLPLREAVPPLDALARRSPQQSGIWAREHAHVLLRRTHRTRFDRAWAFVDARSESAGESLARVLIHELGFAPPTLQRPVRSADGRQIGRVDFWWEEVQVAGEFDGIGKYDLPLHATDAERRRAIREEKEREVALRRVCRDLTRWTWTDLREPARMEAELLRAGVPRRRR